MFGFGAFALFLHKRWEVVPIRADRSVAEGRANSEPLDTATPQGMCPPNYKKQGWIIEHSLPVEELNLYRYKFDKLLVWMGYVSKVKEIVLVLY